jgi:hypothetical protein
MRKTSSFEAKKEVMKLSFLWILLLLSFAQTASSQTICVEKPYSFSSGEKLHYEISYNWGFIWINAGEVHFEASEVQFEKEDVFHFFSTGQSYSRWDWLFKVRDTFEVYSRRTDLQAVFYRRHTLEGGFRIHNKYYFDTERQLYFAEMDETKKGFRTDTIAISGCAYDVLTATYVARSIDFKNHAAGDTIDLQLLLDGRTFILPVVFKGRERIKNRNGAWWDCILFTAMLDRGTMFKPGEALLIWVSDDAHKIPIMMEAKIAVGSIKIYLKSATAYN